MNAAINRRITLAARPVGMPKGSDFSLVEEPVPEPRAGQALVRVLYLSLDPYMRGRMSAAKSYAAPVGIGGVMTGGAVGEVVRSETSGLKEGDLVEGMFGWQEYALCTRGAVRVLPQDGHPPSYALGVLGMPGATGLLRAAGGGPAACRRHGGGLGGLGRRRRGGGPDRQDRRLPRGRHGRQRREGSLYHGRAGLRRGHQLPHGERHRGCARRGLPPPASTFTSTTSAGR